MKLFWLARQLARAAFQSAQQISEILECLKAQTALIDARLIEINSRLDQLEQHESRASPPGFAAAPELRQPALAAGTSDRRNLHQSEMEIGAQSREAYSSVALLERPQSMHNIAAKLSREPLLIDERTYNTHHPAYDATSVRNFPGRVINSIMPTDNVVYSSLQPHITADYISDTTWQPILREALAEASAVPYAHQVFERRDYIDNYRARLEENYRACYSPGWVNMDDALFLYWLVRRLNPNTIVQTGVSNGLSAAFMTLALARNGIGGKLHAIDLPKVFDPGEPSWTVQGQVYGVFIPEGKSSGWMVPDAYNGTIFSVQHGDAKTLLPPLIDSLSSIDMFFHDSDHSYSHMTFEFEQIKRRIGKGGLVVADDISWNASLWDFADQQSAPALNFKGAVGVAFL